MSSDRQIESNRRNAQKSTGPRTEQGKERSRFNAFTHGMTAKFDVLPGEEADSLKARIDAWTADVMPRNPLERELIEIAAVASWQLERVELAHVARLTASVLKATSRENQADEAQPQVGGGNAAIAIDRLGFDDSRKGELLRNYGAACNRTLNDAIDTFVKVRLSGNAGKLVPTAVTVVSSTESDVPVEQGITENEPNSASIPSTETEAAVAAEQRIAENEPNSASVTHTQRINNKEKPRAKVLDRGDRMTRSTPRRWCHRSRRGHRRGLVNTMRPSRVSGSGRRRAVDRRISHGIDSRTTSREAEKKCPGKGASREREATL